MVLRQGAWSRRQHPGGDRPDGFPLWVSEVEPGPVHDITAARLMPCPRCTRPPQAACQPSPTPAMRAPASASRSRSGGRPAAGNLTSITEPVTPSSVPALPRRTSSLLTGRWRILQHITASPSKIGHIARRRSSSPISSTATSHEFRQGRSGGHAHSRAISGHEPSQDSCTLLSIEILTWPARGSTRDSPPDQTRYGHGGIAGGTTWTSPALRHRDSRAGSIAWPHELRPAVATMKRHRP